MEELKACPHCGGKAVFERFNNPKNWYVVRCTVCGCQTDGFRINHDDATDAQNKSANAAVWNRRAEPENKPLTLEQLKQMEGEQVWIPETEAYFSGHGIVNVKEEKVYASDEENDYYPFDEYGAWLAYARKPEGSST